MTDIAVIAQKQIAQGQTLLDQIQGKIKKLIDEFACGELSREQFDKIYEHYQSQIMMATQMMMEADSMAMMGNLTPGETIAIRKGLTAKAKAMTVYYYATGLLLETIGDFDAPIALLSVKLNNIAEQVRLGQKVDIFADKIGEDWVLFVPGKYSTAVMLFSHEPAARQNGLIQSMHFDFERANETALKSGHADRSALVYPFQSFVRRSVKK
jgi:hypothetical protein